MISFFIAIAALILGYVFYGALVGKVLKIDKMRPMPAYTRQDNVDYMPMATWKVFLIQFLNIAGLGPIFGAIMGALYGPAAFLWIVFGSIFAGAVHDFVSATMSIRNGGKSLPDLVGQELGKNVKNVMCIISIALLILVAAVFVKSPAGILTSHTPDWMNLNFWICAIFVYYMLATMLPINKLIGKLYPVFGLALLFMAAGLLVVLIFGNAELDMDFGGGLASRFQGESHPVFPMMFVSIACGAISGFHATQSPMMARCLKNEKLARPVFYGAMIAEGLVALIWAATAIAFTGGYEQLNAYAQLHGEMAATDLVSSVSLQWLGTFGGVLALLGVIAAPITTGDTALRSARLIVADFLNINQKTIWKRFLVCLPIFLLTVGVMLIDFSVLWRYFAWTNQLLSVITLWACTVYLARHRLVYVITLLPALFMTVICTAYILYAPRPEGFGLPLIWAMSSAGIVAALFMTLFIRYMRLKRSQRVLNDIDIQSQI